jgi:hypothetical protein
MYLARNVTRLKTGPNAGAIRTGMRIPWAPQKEQRLARVVRPSANARALISPYVLTEAAALLPRRIIELSSPPHGPQSQVGRCFRPQ